MPSFDTEPVDVELAAEIIRRLLSDHMATIEGSESGQEASDAG